MEKPFPTFVETPTFTRIVSRYLDEDSYALLQTALALDPKKGVFLGGGLRKVRWRARGHGKRGGVRIIYYWEDACGIILMLYIYAKNERSDLTPAQIETLRQFAAQEFSCKKER